MSHLCETAVGYLLSTGLQAAENGLPPIVFIPLNARLITPQYHLIPGTKCSIDIPEVMHL
jgi:hypothetical protein